MSVGSNLLGYGYQPGGRKLSSSFLSLIHINVQKAWLHIFYILKRACVKQIFTNQFHVRYIVEIVRIFKIFFFFKFKTRVFVCQHYLSLHVNQGPLKRFGQSWAHVASIVATISHHFRAQTLLSVTLLLNLVWKLNCDGIRGKQF